MKTWQEIYSKNIELDHIFQVKYSNESKMYEKNCIGLLVELGEFINETKCFKYWTIKKPEKEKVLEEYSDCIMSIMTFHNEEELDFSIPYDKTNNLLELLNKIYSDTTKIYENNDINIVKKIFANIMHIKDYLDISEEDLIEAISKKQLIVEERLNSNY